MDLAAKQRADPELQPLIGYLEVGTLPPDDHGARKITLKSSQYTMEEGVLYRVEDDGTVLREKVFFGSSWG